VAEPGGVILDSPLNKHRRPRTDFRLLILLLDILCDKTVPWYYDTAAISWSTRGACVEEKGSLFPLELTCMPTYSVMKAFGTWSNIATVCQRRLAATSRKKIRSDGILFHIRPVTRPDNLIGGASSRVVSIYPSQAIARVMIRGLDFPDFPWCRARLLPSTEP